MNSCFELLRCVGQAVCKNGIKGLISLVPGGDFFFGVARDSYESWSLRQRSPAERERELKALALASSQEIQRQAEQLARELAADKPAEVRQALVRYLMQLPAMVRRALQRPGDPTGITIPGGLVLRRAEDLLPLLPIRPARFKAGDHPVKGTNWELMELLGVGGFSEVWKARDSVSPQETLVALKFCTDPEAQKRLLEHEAAIIKALHCQGHPGGIVRLLNTHLNNDPPCLEYEYVAGGDLAGLIQEWHRQAVGPTPEQAAKIVLRLAEIIGQVHLLLPPIVHRDLKPANILIQAEGYGEQPFKIADFGIGGISAQQGQARTQRSMSQGQVLATALRGTHTALYASPQQMAGHEPDPRDDVHALGVIWYQLLMGDLTLGRPAGQGWKRRLLDQGNRHALVDLLEKCMEDQPQDRPANGVLLAQQLRQILQTPRKPKWQFPSLAPVLQATGQVLAMILRVCQWGALLLAVVMVLWGCVSLYEYATRSSRAATALKQAQEFLRQGSYEKAVAKYTTVLQLNPNHAESYAQRGQARCALKDYGGAIDDCTRALQLDSGRTEVYRYRGEAFLERKDWQHALEDLNEANQLDADNADVLFLLSRVYEGKGELAKSHLFHGRSFGVKNDSEAAIGEYTEAIKLDNKLAEAYVLRSASYSKKKEFDKALKDCDKAIELDPKLCMGYINRAYIYLDRQPPDLDLAIHDFTQVIRLEPKNLKGYLGRSETYAKKKMFDKALQDANSALAVNPKSGEAYYTRGSIRREMREFDQAVNDITTAMGLVQTVPWQWYFTRARAESSRSHGNQEQAIADYDAALQGDSRNAEIYALRGRARVRQNNLDLALADAARSLELQRDNNALALGLRGDVLIRKRQFDQGIVELKKALEQSPDQPTKRALLDLLGRACYKKGDLTTGDTYFEEAVKLAERPDQIRISQHYCRGIYFASQSNWQQAIAEYNQVLVLSPDNVGSYYHRGLARSQSGDNKEALADFNEVIKRDSNYPNAYTERGRLRVETGDFTGALLDLDEAINRNSMNAQAYLYRAHAHGKLGHETTARSDLKRAVQLDPKIKEELDPRLIEILEQP